MTTPASRIEKSAAEFELVRLGDIAECEMGQSPNSSNVVENPNVGTPFLQGNAEFGATKPKALFGCTKPSKTCEEGDILLSVRAPVGAVNIADQSYCIGRGLAAIRCAGYPSTLIAALLDHRSRLLSRVAQGTTFEAIGKKELHNLEVPRIPPNERAMLSTVLDRVDTAIRHTEAIVEKLKQVRQGLLHDLLTRGTDANGELRPLESEAPHLYKQSLLGRIPKEHDVCSLDRVALRGSGHTPSKSVQAYWDGGIKWVSLADSDKLDKVYIYHTDKEISDLGIANSSAVLHPKDTVILSRDAGIGKSAILGLGMAVSQHFMAWRCGERLDHRYLYYWLQHKKPVFEAAALGSTIQTIGLPFFKRLSIAVPERMEQEIVAERLLATESAASTYAFQAAQLRQQRAGLMDDLLTGRVRITPLLKSHSDYPQSAIP